MMICQEDGMPGCQASTARDWQMSAGDTGSDVWERVRAEIKIFACVGLRGWFCSRIERIP